MARRFTSTDRVAVGTRAIPATAGTLALWWYPEFSQTDGLNHSAFYVENNANTNYFYLNKHASGFGNRLGAGWTTGGLDYRVLVLSTNYTLVQNAWNSLIFTWDASGSFLYLNGTLIGSAVAPSTFTTTGIRYIGNSPGATTPASGRLAEVVICDRVWSARERAAYDAGVLPRRIGPVYDYWPLWGGDSSEQDLGGAGDSGTVTGTTKANHAPVIPFSQRWWGSEVIEGAQPPSVALTGNSSGTGVGTGSLQVSRRLAGSLSGLVVVSASPLVTRRLAGSSAGAGAAPGSLRVSRELAASTSGLGALAGSCRLSRLCAGVSAGSAGVSATPTLTRPLVGDSAGLGTAAGAAAIARRLTATTAGSATPSAAVEIRRLLAGIAPGVGATSGAFYRPPIELSAVCSGAGTASATLQIIRPLTGRGAGAGVITGGVLLRRLLTGSAVAVGRTSGTLTRIRVPGPVTYSGSAAILTAYGGSAELAVDYGGGVELWCTYGGTLEHG